MEALRGKNIFDPRDVSYAVVETNGSLSAALRPENAYPLELPASRDAVEATEAIRESADRRRIGSGLCSVSILKPEKILAAAQKEKHKTCTLRFHAPRWRHP